MSLGSDANSPARSTAGSPQTARVAEVLRARQVRSVVYFHCDHFEPWRNVHGTVSAANAEHIRRFFEVTARIDVARKLSLFYRPHLKPTVTAEPGAVFPEGSPLGFVRPTDEAVAVARSGIGQIATSGHALHLHLHHERVTNNEGFSRQSKWADWLARENSPDADRRRMLLMIDLSLEQVARETGVTLSDWFFIHGNFALNGSDRKVCAIDDEILLLQSRGCRGDFTFPAEPPHDCANPTFEEPSFVRPFSAPKCYDRPEAGRRPAWGAPPAETAGMYFIWAAQPDAYSYVLLDYHQPWVQALCQAPALWAQTIARRALVHDGTLYFQTYAHSMSLKNVVDGKPVFPHDHGPIRSMFGTFMDAAASAGAEISFATVDEVVSRIIGRRGPSGES